MKSTRAAKNQRGFDEMYKLVRDNLKKIDSQEVWIEGILNEEYDDWYDVSDDEYNYQDDSGISDMLEEACEFVHTCMDTERYQEGYEIGNQLFSRVCSVYCRVRRGPGVPGGDGGQTKTDDIV